MTEINSFSFLSDRSTVCITGKNIFNNTYWDTLDTNIFLKLLYKYLYFIKSMPMIFDEVIFEKCYKSGTTDAKVFRIRLCYNNNQTNHVMVIKYDTTDRIFHEANIFHNFAFSNSSVWPCDYMINTCKLEDCDKAILTYRFKGDSVSDIQSLNDIIQRRINSPNGICEVNDLIKILQSTLNEIKEYYYGNPEPSRETPKPISQIFAEILPASHVIVEDNNVACNGHDCVISYNGCELFGIEPYKANGFPYIKYKNKYIFNTATTRVRVDFLTKDLINNYNDLLNCLLGKKPCYTNISGKVFPSHKPLDDLITDIVTTFNSYGFKIDTANLIRRLDTPVNNVIRANMLHGDFTPHNLLLVYNRHGQPQQCLVIDWGSFFVNGGPFFIDLARLEANIIFEYILNIYESVNNCKLDPNNFDRYKINWLESMVNSIETSIFKLNQNQYIGPERQKIEPLLNIILMIRSIALNWGPHPNANTPITQDFYKNYLYARYSYLISFIKISGGPALNAKKLLALLFAHALDNLLTDTTDFDIGACVQNRRPAQIGVSNSICIDYPRQKQHVVGRRIDVGGRGSLLEGCDLVLLISSTQKPYKWRLGRITSPPMDISSVWEATSVSLCSLLDIFHREFLMHALIIKQDEAINLKVIAQSKGTISNSDLPLMALAEAEVLIYRSLKPILFGLMFISLLFSFSVREFTRPLTWAQTQQQLLQEKIMDKLIKAHVEFNSGGKQGRQKAVEIYKRVFEKLPRDAINYLDQERLTEAKKAAFDSPVDVDDAARKSHDLFALWLKQSIGIEPDDMGPPGPPTIPPQLERQTPTVSPVQQTAGFSGDILEFFRENPVVLRRLQDAHGWRETGRDDKALEDYQQVISAMPPAVLKNIGAHGAHLLEMARQEERANAAGRAVDHYSDLLDVYLQNF